jgi:uncharacterized protein (TIGR00661 family)
LANYRHKKFLICPLNWGMGHASRCVPIIRKLLDYGQTVYLASDGDALLFLRREFPELEYCELPAYDPVYSRMSSGMVVKLASQIPKFISAINREHAFIERIVKEKRIDLVISDNRYGCYSNRVKSILLTHQVNIKLPSLYGFLEPFVNYYHRQRIDKFYRVWVPDFKDDRNFTGELSDSNAIARRYIGQLSRMVPMDRVNKYDLLAIVSGPEPQRSIFERLLRSQLLETNIKALLVKGKPTGSSDIVMNGHLAEVDFLESHELNVAIAESSMVISRPGYSTIMDLAKLGKPAIFIPTPGQTEQIYLASRLLNRGITYSREQSGFKLDRALKKTRLYSGFKSLKLENDLLEEAILKIIK